MQLELPGTNGRLKISMLHIIKRRFVRDKDKLKVANDLEKEIYELERFIYRASRVWTGRLTIKEKIMYFITDAYGMYNDELNFKMKTEIKDRVLQVLETYKEELEEKFKSL